MDLTPFKIFVVLQLISIQLFATHLKISHSGSSQDTQTNTLSGAYSPVASDEDLEPPAWEINASAARSTVGIEAAFVATNIYDLGWSYTTKNSFTLTATFSADSAGPEATQSVAPSLSIEKKWNLNGSEIDESDDDDDDDDFSPGLGFFITGLKRNAIQKKNQIIPKNFTVEQRTFEYGINFSPLYWLSIDINTSQFSYDRSISGADSVATTDAFTTQFGWSYSYLLESFCDQENTARLTLKFAPASYLELSTSKSHAIVTQDWSTSYTAEFYSTFTDSLGYSTRLTQTKNTTTSTASYSGSTSLTFYF